MKKYITPEFDVTVYELDDEIAVNESYTGDDLEFGKDDPNEGGDWFG